MEILKKNRIIAVILLISVVCTALLTGARIGIENQNKNVTMIMNYRDVFYYARAAEIDVKEALADFAEIGVTGIVVENRWFQFSETEIGNVKAAGLEPILRPVRDLTVEEYDALVQKYEIRYPLYLAFRYLIGDTEAYLNANGVTLALVENKDQRGHESIRGFKAEESNVRMVRVFELIRSFAARYAVLGYQGAEEIENILYRAVSDRNIRVLWITPFYDSKTGAMITDFDEYRAVMKNLAARMKPHGLILGGTFSSMAKYTPNAWLVLGCFAGICVLAVLLLGTFLPLDPKRRWILSLALFALSAAAFFFRRALTLKLMAFVIVSVTPCLAIRFLLECLKRTAQKRPALPRCLLHAVGILAAVLLILLAGGSYAGAILSESDYMLEFEFFRGVKLSQAIPLIYTVVLIAKEFVYQKGMTLRALAAGLAKNASGSKKLIAVFAVLGVLGAAALFIVRTGNTILQAGVLEQRFRIFFEETCVARPRTKEFLIAWPALIAAVLLFSKDRKILGSAALFGASIGCASVCNTFCHIRAYYLLSVMRTGYGAAIGLVLGLLCALALNFLLWAIEAKKTQ